VNNMSKFIPGIAPLVDRDSSSFPLNSQLEFKRDFVNSSSYGFDYQPLSQYSTAKYPTPSPSYNPQSSPAYVATVSSQVTKLESNVNKLGYKNDGRTEVSSEIKGSPLKSNYVKDAKSITYDKNVYSSYIGDDRNHGQ
jgi:hypothetical protein